MVSIPAPWVSMGKSCSAAPPMTHGTPWMGGFFPGEVMSEFFLQQGRDPFAALPLTFIVEGSADPQRLGRDGGVDPIGSTGFHGLREVSIPFLFGLAGHHFSN